MGWQGPRAPSTLGRGQRSRGRDCPEQLGNFKGTNWGENEWLIARFFKEKVNPELPSVRRAACATAQEREGGSQTSWSGGAGAGGGTVNLPHPLSVLLHVPMGPGTEPVGCPRRQAVRLEGARPDPQGEGTMRCGLHPVRVHFLQLLPVRFFSTATLTRDPCLPTAPPHPPPAALKAASWLGLVGSHTDFCPINHAPSPVTRVRGTQGSPGSRGLAAWPGSEPPPAAEPRSWETVQKQDSSVQSPAFGPQGPRLEPEQKPRQQDPISGDGRAGQVLLPGPEPRAQGSGPQGLLEGLTQAKGWDLAPKPCLAPAALSRLPVHQGMAEG